MEDVLKKYDKLLSTKKNNDGTVSVVRKSPFDTQKEHIIFTIGNQYIGSGMWVLRRLTEMDTTRNDIVGKAMRHNLAIRNRVDDRRMHYDVADFIISGGNSFIN